MKISLFFLDNSLLILYFIKYGPQSFRAVLFSSTSLCQPKVIKPLNKKKSPGSITPAAAAAAAAADSRKRGTGEARISFAQINRGYTCGKMI